VNPPLPKAFLLDLDDTILDDSSTIDDCWREACTAHREEFLSLDPEMVYRAVRKTGEWFWSDADRHRIGRLDLDGARREVVRLALADVGIRDQSLAGKIALSYSQRRDGGMQALPGAIDTVRWLRTRGCRIALLTNGAGPAQRKKIDRFELGDLFDTVLVEGEVGFGKPDPRIYLRALQALGVEPADAWMAGDNLEWDVAAPQRLGLFGIWIDVKGVGVPATSHVRPDRVVRALAEVRCPDREEENA